MIKQYFEFRTLITPFWAQFGYAIGAFGITAICLVAIITPSTFADYDNNAKHVVADGAIMLLMGNLVWRMLCEAAIVIYSIHSLLVSIDNKAELLINAKIAQTE